MDYKESFTKEKEERALEFEKSQAELKIKINVAEKFLNSVDEAKFNPKFIKNIKMAIKKFYQDRYLSDSESVDIDMLQRFVRTKK